MNEHTGSEPLAICTAPSLGALISTKGSLEALHWYSGSRTAARVSDLEPVVKWQESFNWHLSQADKRGRGILLFFFFLNRLLWATSSSRAPAPPMHRHQGFIHFSMGGEQSKILYLCSLPGDLASTALTNICSCSEIEKPNFLCDACITPPRVDIFNTRNKSFVFKHCFFFFFSWLFLEIKGLSKTL